jgi:hypothetical protein
MIGLVVLAVVLAIGMIPVTGRRLFGQRGQEDIESREERLATAVEVETLVTTWRVRHRRTTS